MGRGERSPVPWEGAETPVQRGGQDTVARLSRKGVRELVGVAAVGEGGARGLRRSLGQVEEAAAAGKPRDDSWVGLARGRSRGRQRRISVVALAKSHSVGLPHEEMALAQVGAGA
eukprot:3935109-Pyramimonas_sp.AAC.1